MTFIFLPFIVKKERGSLETRKRRDWMCCSQMGTIPQSHCVSHHSHWRGRKKASEWAVGHSRPNAMGCGQLDKGVEVIKSTRTDRRVWRGLAWRNGEQGGERILFIQCVSEYPAVLSTLTQRESGGQEGQCLWSGRCVRLCVHASVWNLFVFF